MKQKPKKNPQMIKILNVEFCDGVACVINVSIIDKINGNSKEVCIEFNRNSGQLEFGMQTGQASMVFLTDSELRLCKEAFLRAKKLNFSNMEF